MSEVIQTLVEISQDGTSYSGDLLSTIDVLRNMTEIFRRAYYSPTPGDVQVGPSRAARGRGTWGGLDPSLTLSPDGARTPDRDLKAPVSAPSSHAAPSRSLTDPRLVSQAEPCPWRPVLGSLAFLTPF